MLAIFIAAIVPIYLAHEYPVPIPAGGRRDVHGWLILPWEQTQSSDPAAPIKAWFSHHVPEFWVDSPHNFQIILEGSLVPLECVEDELFPLAIPIPPNSNYLTYEYSFTPPSPFSLNDLLSGAIVNLSGVYYNGSFDTPYERIPMSLASLHIYDLTTAVYLDEYQETSFKNLRYLSYPRGGLNSSHFYFAHEIHAQPDFDHIVHVTLTNCVTMSSTPLRFTPGLSWELMDTENTLENKLYAGQVAEIRSIDTGAGSEICSMTVLESLHCMIGPGFMDNC